MYDLLIKGGTIVDPAQSVNGPADVAFVNGTVASVAPNISEDDASEIFDASGLIVTPGLIDLHVHNFWGVSHYGIDPDVTNIGNGVTTAVDAGSAGAATFDAFRRYVIERADTRLYALLNISLTGMISDDIGELEDLRHADVGQAVRVGRQNRDRIVGIKARLSQDITRQHDVESLKRAIEAAEAIDGFVMIHVGKTHTPLESLIKMLRPGDVVTHSFHGHAEGILDDAGKVKEAFREHKRRGIVFDVGHGAGSFSFDVAERAMADGFRPGNISSDLHLYNVEGPVFDQVTTISKLIWLGMSLYDVIGLTTVETAKTMGVHDRLGTLKAGAVGDATIARIDEGSFKLTDSYGRSVTSRKRLTHVATVKSGRMYKPWLRGT
ncbi:MAG: amidohydrolase/deacetylase family metallohydrolase [Dehalococcoidia bacterium]|nr:amidohydrolase/deacetylase family metallohydrolase [Dehalococcoidia bacterium]